MDLHRTSCGICPYLPNLWLKIRRMIVVEHAGIKVSYWGFGRSVQPVNTSGRNQQKNEFLVDFCFELTAWNPFSSDLPLLPKSLVDKRRMIVVEHVEICSYGICNCSCSTSIEKVVGFTVLVVDFHLLNLQLMDLHWISCGIRPYQQNFWLIVRRMRVVEHAGIKISYWVSSSKSLVDKRRFRQKCPASQHVRKEPTKNKFLVDFFFELTAWNPFSSDLPLPPKSLIDNTKMIVCRCRCHCRCRWPLPQDQNRLLSFIIQVFGW